MADLDFLVGTRIVDADKQQETVELGFGQRIRAGLFHGILRCEHEERRG